MQLNQIISIAWKINEAYFYFTAGL